MIDTYLIHHGIKGQKWGVRRYRNEDGSLTDAGKQHYAENYRTDQIDYDTRVYGRRGSERVNKKLKEGYKISEARSSEADRIYATRRIGRYVGAGTAAVGGILGAYGAYKLGKKLGTTNAAQKFFNSSGIRDVNQALSAIGHIQVNATTLAVGAGGLGLAAGGVIGRKAGHGATMAVGGYSPKKFRYS